MSVGKLYKRGKIWWYQHRGERTSTQCHDKAAAEAEARNIERRAADPNYKAAEARLDDCLDLFFQEQRAKKKAPGTLDMHSAHIVNLTKHLGASLRLSDLAPPAGAREIDRYLAKRTKDKAKRTTQAKELSTLKGALRGAQRRGEFPWALEQVMPYRFAQQYVPGKRALTLAQVYALLGALEPKRGAVVAFIVLTGADWHSAETAEAADLQELKCLVRGTKNRRRWRTIPVLEPFAWLVPTIRAAGPPFETWTNVRRDLALACERAHVPKITPRDLRRTHGKVLRALGIEPHLIAGMLGHADSRMVERVYGELENDQLDELMRARLGTGT